MPATLAEALSPTVAARRAQAFPALDAGEVERVRAFATPCRYADGERIYETGKPTVGLILVLAGAIRITARDGHGHDLPIVEHGIGSLAGELGQLARRRSLVDGIAVGDVQGLLVDSDHLQALLVGDATLGEKIMRALIIRRVGLLETGYGGPVLVGYAGSHDVARLRNFLTRNSFPHLLIDPATDADARAFVEQYAPAEGELPLAICPDGVVLRNPSEDELARCLGMLDAVPLEGSVYDVAVAGAGPAGLATAVYAASEGLSVIVLDARAFGGQAGASARIENYFGFPTGISGQALTARAFTQAQKFGARMLIPAQVRKLDCARTGPEAPLGLQLADGRSVKSRTVIIATGARYRRPECSNLQAMEGHGVWYWASPIEAKMCAGEEVVLVGGGNSAGQAAVFLAGHAKKVWMLVRGPGLAASMSKYLIDRIAATSKIELRTHTEIAHIQGNPAGGVENVTWRNRQSGERETHAIRNVFMFLGADPATEWLAECGVAVDAKGFVASGTAAAGSLETSIPGVFAIGDVRSGSVKRVGAAIGEGAAVVAQIHAYLARRAEAVPA
jgi:thioredoxin reductase (NADPH)